MRGERSATTATVASGKQAAPPPRVTPQESAAREEPLLDMQQQIGNREMTRLLDSSAAANGSADANGGTDSKSGADTKPPETADDREARKGAEEEREKATGPVFTAIVDDEANEIGPDQMRKSEFLEALRESLCSSADEGMAGTGYTSMSCPYIGHWIGEYQGKSVAHLERAIRKFAPEAAGAPSASKVIDVVTARVRRSVDQWARTGEITGLPDAVPAMLPGAGMFGGEFFKARPGGAHVPTGGAHAVRTQLGPGRALDGQVRGRMERAFGVSFARVRLHTGPAASRLSEQMNAHAFTVGRDVAFGAGRYQPGHPIGDALIAHELAHVVQQGAVSEPAARLQTQPTATASAPDGALRQETAPLEADANRSAAGAVARLWSGTRAGLANLRAQAGPRLRAGLTLSRCSGCGKKKEAAKPQGVTDPNTCETSTEMTAVIQEIRDTYGFRAVGAESGKCWTLPELRRVKTSLNRVPQEHRTALRGVELRRVTTSSCQGDASGCFKADIEGEQQRDVLEIPDQFFNDDKEVLDTSIARTIRHDLAGQVITTLPSEETALHEAGHAFETQVRRESAMALARAQTAQTVPDANLDAAIAKWNGTSQRVNFPGGGTAKEQAYKTAVGNAGAALRAVITPVSNLPAPNARTARQVNTAVGQVVTRIAAARTAITRRNTARAALPAGSSVLSPAVESMQDANLVDADALLVALRASAAAQAQLDTATAAHDAATVTLRLSNTLTITVSRRLAELVALINIRNIDIANSGLSHHAKSNWPHNPAEVYATMYEHAITQPRGLRTLDAAVADFFTAPVGPKGAFVPQIDRWIATRRVARQE